MATTTGDAYTEPISDSLPHYQYVRALDSFQRANRHLEERPHTTRSGTGIGEIGIYEGEDSNEYYLALPGYQRLEDAEFFRKGNKNYIRENVWDSTWEENGLKNAKGHQETKETPIQFIQTKQGELLGKVLVPVSKGAFSFWSIAFLVIGVLITAAGLVIVLGGAIRLLMEIAKGRAFTECNIQRLYRIAIYFLSIGMALIILRFLLHLWHKDSMPDSLLFVWVEWLQSGSGSIVAGLIILLFANAFKQGYELAKDRDLTI